MCIGSVLCACGASGVAGGSLMLIPLACSIFGISYDIAMQIVGIGFIIGVIQDSTETALNSSTDVLFTAAACYRADRIAKAKGLKTQRELEDAAAVAMPSAEEEVRAAAASAASPIAPEKKNND